VQNNNEPKLVITNINFSGGTGDSFTASVSLMPQNLQGPAQMPMILITCQGVKTPEEALAKVPSAIVTFAEELKKAANNIQRQSP
jgi:hypothetical protein